MRSLKPHALRAIPRPSLRLAARPKWACPDCRPHTVRWSSSDSSPNATEKPYYITTPIFYVNASPHVGHLYSMVLADVLKRWQQLKGRQAVLCTGTDEHGMKIQNAAVKERMPPKHFCDFNSRKFMSLALTADVSHDFFLRTTDDHHKEAVNRFWLQLKHSLPEDRGLYKGTHQGWYCVDDECFYPEDMVKASIEPQTGNKILINAETENEVEWVDEETWFFPLTKYKDDLLEFYDANPDWITPAHKMKEVRHWVENHLEDLSVTRPASRLSWGIPDPEDDQQTIYVWVDALINYITNAGYGAKWHTAKENMGPWPADLHVIGKDILRFHCIYWPALLMAMGLPLPKKILCHSHWTMSNRKMSKSRGNVVDPFFAMQRWDTDPLRYFLMRSSNYSKDMSYSNQLIGPVYLKELQANLGNLFYRIARPKVTGKWSTVEAVSAYRNDGAKKRYFSLEPHLERAASAFSDEMDKYNTSGAIREVFELLRETNRYVADAEPWNLVKSADPRARTYLNWVIFNGAEALRIAAILLQPVMPTKAGILLEGLGGKPERRTLKYAHKGKDTEYGTSAESDPNGPKIKKWGTVFPPTPNKNDSDMQVLANLRALLDGDTRSQMSQMAEMLAMESRMGEAAVQRLLLQAPNQDYDGSQR
ncbi:methionyl-tRNA synthetase [Ophiocordyceps sinensis CO18]|uniref:Probable methionine--tRNA ligase, mitochondrial n=1 Tax=Ophiocordyceps sinensis (strain Co18 / CGMCC 3.14243) TaxID=911162 RepID=T5AKI1_OPHSC|nr:methionyl-tRNA synthetase [Ophiocordyceps sinensis CO18]